MVAAVIADALDLPSYETWSVGKKLLGKETGSNMCIYISIYIYVLYLYVYLYLYIYIHIYKFIGLYVYLFVLDHWFLESLAWHHHVVSLRPKVDRFG